MDKYCIRSGETWEEFEDRQNGILLREELHRRTPDIPAPAPALTIPGDAALADDNAAAEQREEWADYGDETVRTTWFYPTAPVMLCQGWRVVDERYHSEMCWDITWQRPCLLSADYA